MFGNVSAFPLQISRCRYETLLNSECPFLCNSTPMMNELSSCLFAFRLSLVLEKHIIPVDVGWILPSYTRHDGPIQRKKKKDVKKSLKMRGLTSQTKERKGGSKKGKEQVENTGLRPYLVETLEEARAPPKNCVVQTKLCITKGRLQEEEGRHNGRRPLKVLLIPVCMYYIILVLLQWKHTIEVSIIKKNKAFS